MRQILMTVLLIITVVTLYMSIVGSDGGTKEQITSSGDRMARWISGISP
ncbi:MAG: hypothetical protein P0Y55_03710 [Candidatus Cohnella colombiensis]|uniref:Uncharacterized protein n=1 Tax=Candidatus Cohnella colombiensis TaxID=3121368 RepID=A0AA95EXC2_9BACL|nr:MAG: hypothetical protein P0Y55_03710 [Cohnella sp.]